LVRLISGGSLITKILFQNGINKAFCVPGESYLGILEAIRNYKNRFDLVVCRHEGGASYMAETYGRLTKKPGICLVTRGPGACNAAIGVHTAYHEGTPMILFVGQVPVNSLNKNAFQSINPDKVFKSMCKYSTTIKDQKYIKETIEKAINISMDGKPGPVVITVPEDIQFAMIKETNLKLNQIKNIKSNFNMINRLTRCLSNSSNPIIILSGSKWTQSMKTNLEIFAKKHSIPIAVTFRKGDLFNNQHKNYIGSIGVGPDSNLISYAENSDLIILIGGEFGEIETKKFARFKKSDDKQLIFHVTSDPKIINNNKSSYKILSSNLESFCKTLNELKIANKPLWKKNITYLRKSYENYRIPKVFKNRSNPGVAIKDISDIVSNNTIVTAGAGNYTHFVLRHHVFKKLNTLLAPINAPMGYSVPSAIAAAIINRAKEVICYAGDGCFMMNFQEIVIAVARNLNITFIIFNNGIYGSIRMHQELKYPGKSIATDLNNPNFLALANSFGIKAIDVDDPKNLIKNYINLRKGYKGPILINMMTDPFIINPQKTISELNAQS
tara:strand:- start:532 stop:2196 length:1665 start_codon:yes stop_codon:yes gene_type:complete